ncbi:MAG: AbrB/MazE/SpoVT family DNA-binding domain-containing protein [Defluviitaleaceae bacterium]|nr:AbrB/MazE/SpoVT family DNA-binding domain-containing protein [Defluviitaleaceae bacterium]
MTTTIQKWGNSNAVRLPKIIMDALFLKENDPIEIIPQGDHIVLKKATRTRRAKKSLEERFAEYTGDYECVEYDWGKAVGREFDWDKPDGGEGWKQ